MTKSNLNDLPIGYVGQIWSERAGAWIDEPVTITRREWLGMWNDVSRVGRETGDGRKQCDSLACFFHSHRRTGCGDSKVGGDMNDWWREAALLKLALDLDARMMRKEEKVSDERVTFATLKEARAWVRAYGRMIYRCDPPHTIITVCARCNGEMRAETGIAKRNPTDTWNSEMGVRIARGRAEKKLAVVLYRAYADPPEHVMGHCGLWLDGELLGGVMPEGAPSPIGWTPPQWKSALFAPGWWTGTPVKAWAKEVDFYDCA